MNQCTAFSFRSPLGLKAMLGKLESSCPCKWHLGDSDTFGEYLVCRPFSDLTRVRIVEVDGGFVLDIYFHSDDPSWESAWKDLLKTVVDKILPGLEAKGVEKTQTLD